MTEPDLKQSRTFRDMSVDDLWELMWRPGQDANWLGDVTCEPPVARTRIAIGDDAGPWRSGWFTDVTPGARVEAALDPAAGWPAGPTKLIVSVVADANGDARLSITEVGLADVGSVDAAGSYWAAALNRLAARTHEVSRRRDNPRQAIVIIHGIGEQQPGRTLRSFMRSGVVTAPADSTWVKPDRVSGSFELRLTQVGVSDDDRTPGTDVYEFYWAHLIRDTTLGQVSGWIRHLLLRRTIPGPLRPAINLVRVIVLAVLLAIGIQFFWRIPWLSATSFVVVLSGLAWRLVGRKVAIDTVGDAARYLSPDPGNIARRQEIRQAGVDLVNALHDGNRYDRIAILGHSLGSVIAYDVITFAWLQMNVKHQSPQHTSFTAGTQLEKAIQEAKDVDEAQAAQHDAWLELRRNTQPWLITDLVTVGSPLTYGEFLMATNVEEFDQAQTDRVLPTCPPMTEIGKGNDKHQHCSYPRSYDDPLKPGTKLSFTVYHHAAPFAVTRWTNLYFKVGWLGATGDLVGGPVAPRFGEWVKDVPLISPVRRFAHTHYWLKAKSGDAHLTALHDALHLEAGAELRALVSSIPAFALEWQRPSPR